MPIYFTNVNFGFLDYGTQLLTFELQAASVALERDWLGRRNLRFSEGGGERTSATCVVLHFRPGSQSTIVSSISHEFRFYRYFASVWISVLLAFALSTRLVYEQLMGNISGRYLLYIFKNLL